MLTITDNIAKRVQHADPPSETLSVCHQKPAHRVGRAALQGGWWPR